MNGKWRLLVVLASVMILVHTPSASQPAKTIDALILMERGLALLGDADPDRASEAVTLLEQAAMAGAPAAVLLGDAYRHGIGIIPDLAKAAHWYRIAAEMGDGLAQYELARLYLTGRGVMPSIIMAGFYLELADVYVRDEAVRAQVQDLIGHIRLRASSADWQQIRRLVGGWRPKELDELLN